uniref:DUF262 domain-containing protein n=1 Tax=uncultured marine bacterium 580 TaxID=257400 RepID=Q6SFJ8_9BACT|nr:conserved hypothetical protein [uncultured marine bacterium 580]
MITQKCNIKDIYKRKIKVPKFQRDYVWDDNNRLELWEDLNNYLEDTKNVFFLGTILLIGKEVTADNAQNLEYEIIDGQQRLTTMTILLLALKVRSKRVSGDAEDNGYKEIWKNDELREPRAHSVHDEIQSILNGSSGVLHAPFTFTPNEHIKKTFLAMAQDDWRGVLDPKTNSKIKDDDFGEVKKTFEDFEGKMRDIINNIDTDIEKYEYILKLFNLITKTEIIEVVNESREEAGRIFEGLNDRGEPLGVGDLMKNYILMSIDDQKNKEKEDLAKQDSFIKRWREICQRTNQKDDSNNPKIPKNPKPASVTTMLKHFAQMVSHTRVAKSNLYKELKSYYNNECEKKYDTFLKTLNTFSEIYQDFIISNHETVESFKNTMKKYTDESVDNKLYLAINLFRIHSLINPTPMICSLFFALKEEKIKIKHFTSAILSIEKYSVVHQWIRDKHTNQKDFDYKDYSAFLFNKRLEKTVEKKPKLVSETTEKIVTEFINSFNTETISRKDFIKEFKKLSYKKSTKDKQIVNLLLRIRLYDDPMESNDVHIDSMTYKSGYECEHFYPASKRKSKDVYIESSIYDVDNIGNLLPLSGKRNKEFSNYLPAEKYKKFSEESDSSDKVYLDVFIDEYKKDFEGWNLKAIEARAEKLADKAYDIWVAP